MRIIAGEFRGRRLLPPADQATRPITDRVKQSLFDILSQRLPGAAVFDVFAGTGSLGLEALSRGAASCTFFERHRPAAERLRRNIQALGVVGRASVITADILSLREPDLRALARPALVFLDPPYPLVRERGDALRQAAALFASHLEAGGQLILRLERGEKWEPGLIVQDDRTWGTMRVLFLGPPTC